MNKTVEVRLVLPDFQYLFIGVFTLVNDANRKNLPKSREEVLRGITKYRVAKEMEINELVVYSHTSDLPSVKLGEACIKGESLDILNQLLEKGFVHSNIKTNYFLRIPSEKSMTFKSGMNRPESYW